MVRNQGTWSIPLAFALAVAGATLSPKETRAQVVGRWLGQDKQDLAGSTTAVEPNGVQDVHIVLGGLPARSEIASAVIAGHGADEWKYGDPKQLPQFTAVVVRKPNATTADVFFEPLRVETGREFHVVLKFDDGNTAEVYLKGGRADPNLRMPDAAMAARWVGQEKTDVAGAGPGVGPDGLQDAKIALSRLAPRDKIRSVLLEDASSRGSKWSFGPNPEGHHNAELVLDPKNPAEGSLYFHPDRDLTGHRLKLTVAYENGKTDTAAVAGGKADHKLAMPRVTLPRVALLSTVKARWVGQDGSAETGPGDVHVALSGLPANRAIAAAVLTDGVRGSWVYRPGDRVPLDVEPDALPLAMRRGAVRTSAEMFFPPERDESKTTITLRLVFQDGEAAVATFAGGPCDPARRAPVPERSETVAQPGADLERLAAQFGTVRLSKGDYTLNRPLVLGRPVSLVGEPGAVLRFEQGAGETPWTSAIKIHSGGVTLRGFAVRFAGPVRWRNDVSWGPAVIGTTDNFDSVPKGPKRNLTFESLDIEIPPPLKNEGWEEAPKLLRLLDATDGRIAGNTLLGGSIEFFGGPWVVENNVYRGVPDHTFSPALFAAHDPHDLVVRNNRAKPGPRGGKTWRFLLLTTRGRSDVVEKNVVEGVGPRDDDAIPAMNSPEIFLTESYHLRFEGRPAAVSADGRLVKVAKLPGEPPRSGDVVSILSGTGAGQFRTIAQRVDSTTYWLEAPLPKGADVIAISPGFVNEVFEGNSVDARGGKAAAGFVLAGNHFGTRVVNNKVTGAGDAFQLTAYPSETPGIWGWSHAPYLGGVFEGNTVEDSERGAQIGVHHYGGSKSNKGRVYMTIAVKGNTVRWTDGFLGKLASAGAKKPPVGIELGYLPSIDPGELVVDAKENRLVAPARVAQASAFKVNAAVLNGRTVSQRSYPLPLPPAASAGAAGLQGSPGAGNAPRR
jgi:hypothetical protein